MTALRVIPATEAIPVSQLVVVIYGQPGAGKTTFAYSADNPYLMDFDGGARRSGARRGDTGIIEQWADVEGVDLSGADTVIVDTAGAALDKLALHLIEENSKLGTKAGGLTRSGWGALKTRFSAWIKSLMATGKDVVIVTHGKEEARGDTGDFVMRLEMVGGSKEFVYQLADIMGFFYREGDKRFFNCSPAGGLWGKNPATWKAVKVGFGTSTLAKLLKDAKAKIGKASVGAGVAAKAAAKPKGKPKEEEEPELTLGDVNERLKELVENNASDAEKRALLKQARDAGFSYDKKAKSFVA